MALQILSKYSHLHLYFPFISFVACTNRCLSRFNALISYRSSRRTGNIKMISRNIHIHAHKYIFEDFLPILKMDNNASEISFHNI